MTDQQAESLRQLLRTALSKSREPDPGVVARRVALKLEPEILIEAATWGLREMAYEENRKLRNVASAPGPSRRDYLRRVDPAGDWKFLDECTHSDLLALAGEYRTRSESMLAKAVQFETLATELAASGCATVGEMRARKDLAA